MNDENRLSEYLPLDPDPMWEKPVRPLTTAVLEELEKLGELPPQGSPEKSGIDLSCRLQRYHVADLHREFGQMASKYGAVTHQGRTFQTCWKFTTEVYLSRVGEDFDPHLIGAVSTHVDYLLRKLPTAKVTVKFIIESDGALPTDLINPTAMEEPKGVANED